MGNQQSSPVSLPDLFQIEHITNVPVSHTGDTEITLLVEHTISGGKIGANGSVRIRMSGYTTGNNDVKGLLLYLSDEPNPVDATIDPAVDPYYFTFDIILHNQNDEAVQKWFTYCPDDTIVAAIFSLVSGTINTAEDTVLTIDIELSHADDSIVITSFVVEIFPKD